MEGPSVLVNFKSFPELWGGREQALARLCDDISRDKEVLIGVAPRLPMLAAIADRITAPVYAQRMDPVTAGDHTGLVTATALREAGAAGALLNHAHRKITMEDLARCVALLRKESLEGVAFAGTLEEVKAVAEVGPRYLAWDGGDPGETKLNPDALSEAIEATAGAAPDTKVLCATGIRRAQDVRRALSLGATGVVVDALVVQAKKPKAVLLNLISAF